MRASELEPVRRRTRSNPREVRFKREAAEAIAAEAGCITGLQRAAFFGVTSASWSKVVRTEVRPGEPFIAAVVGSHPDDPRFVFETFFEVV